MIRLPRLAGYFGIRETLTNDLRDGKVKPIRIVNLTVIESKHLLVNVAEQMKRFNANVT